jgi:hypothetical protein
MEVRRSCHLLVERTMLILQREQRRLLAETVRDIANVAAGAMVFGQFLADQVFSRWLVFGGMAIWIVLVAYALALSRGEEKP